MFQNLIGLAWGLGAFALIVGISVVVLQNFGSAVANCAPGYTYNTTLQVCHNATDVTNTSPISVSTTTTNYLMTQMGQTGLSGWAPAIIALSVGLLFLGAFALTGRKGV